MQSKLRHSLRVAALDGEETFKDLFVSSISDEKLLHTLEASGIQLTQHEKRQLLARLDPTGVGTVKCEEFLHFAGFDDLEMDQIGQRVLRRLQELTQDGVDYRSVFRSMDMEERGVITRRELRRAARELSLPLTEAELMVLMRRFSQFDSDQLILYGDLLRFVTTRQKKVLNMVMADKARRDRGKSLQRNKPEMQEERLMRDGSGFDGLGRCDPQHRNTRSVLGNQSTENSTSALLVGNEPSNHSSEIAHSLLKNGSFSKNETRRLENLIDEYRLELNKHGHVKQARALDGSVIVNHGENTISRLVDHGKVAHAVEELKLSLKDSIPENSACSSGTSFAKRKLSCDICIGKSIGPEQSEDESSLEKLRGLLEDPLTFAGLVLTKQAALDHSGKHNVDKRKCNESKRNPRKPRRKEDNKTRNSRKHSRSGREHWNTNSTSESSYDSSRSGDSFSEESVGNSVGSPQTRKGKIEVKEDSSSDSEAHSYRQKKQHRRQRDYTLRSRDYDSFDPIRDDVHRNRRK